MRNRRGLAVFGVLLVALTISVIAPDFSASARATNQRIADTATVTRAHRSDVLGPIAPKVDPQKVRRASGLRSDVVAVAVFVALVTAGLAMWLRRHRGPLGSPHLLQSIVRGRSPPRLLVVL